MTTGRPNAESDSQLAQDLTNPIASFLQVRFQNNSDFGGSRNNDGFRYTLDVQPVTPLALTNNWPDAEQEKSAPYGRGADFNDANIASC